MSANAPTTMNWKGKVLYRPPHQNGSCDSTVPKYHYVQPTAGNPSGAWSTSGKFLDFVIPKEIGTLYNLTFRFLINNTSGVAKQAPPTPFWFSSVEVSIGSKKLETIYPGELYNESIGFLALDMLDSLKPVLNASTNEALNYTECGSIPTGVSTYFLPFSSCLTTSRIYAAGIKEDIKIRVYFPPGLLVSTVSLSDLTLVVDEDVGSREDKDAWIQAHSSGIVYNTVVRQRQNVTVNRLTGNTQTVDLTGLSGSSAGLLVYSNSGALATSETIADQVTRYNISALTLQDQMGNKLTEELTGVWLKSFVWPKHVGTSFPVEAATFLVPFSADFRKAVEEGVNCGQFAMDGNQKLLLGAATSTRTESINITNYTYQSIIVVNGKVVAVIERY